MEELADGVQPGVGDGAPAQRAQGLEVVEGRRAFAAVEIGNEMESAHVQ